jgi:hypothetical protein
LIEGKIGRIDPSKLSKNVIPVPIDSSAETEHQFHCCMVIVWWNDSKQSTLNVQSATSQHWQSAGITMINSSRHNPNLVMTITPMKASRLQKIEVKNFNLYGG